MIPDFLQFPTLLVVVGGISLLFVLWGLFHKGTPKPEEDSGIS